MKKNQYNFVFYFCFARGYKSPTTLSEKVKLLTNNPKCWSVSAAAPWLLAKTLFCVARTYSWTWMSACLCVLLADRNLIYSNGAVLGCEAVRSEAPAELSSAGAYNITMSWGPVLMAWGALTAIVPSRPTTPWTYTTPSCLHLYPLHLFYLSVQSSLPQIAYWASGLGAPGL